MKKLLRVSVVFPVAIAASCGAFWWTSPSTQAAPDQAKVPISTEPVESDMHEFMEYVFQPTYRRLKASLATKPGDNKAWGAVKSDALILAEGGNLILMRKPDEHAADWARHAANVRSHGGQLYRTAKKKEYAAVRKHYEAMLTSCNACHQQFADGEHQLEP